MEHLGFKIEVEGLLIVDRQSRFEDSMMPLQHLMHMIIFHLCRESLYFEDIVKFLIFRLRMIYNFFQICQIALLTILITIFTLLGILETILTIFIIVKTPTSTQLNLNLT